MAQDQQPPVQYTYPQPPAPIQPSDGGYTEQRSGCSGCAWGIGGAFGCMVLLILPFVVLILAGTLTINGIIGGIRDIFNPQPQSAQVITTQTIITGIQPMGQLVSISAQLAKADIQVGIQQGALNACGFSANHVAQGTVEAGIDLANISADNITYDALTNTYRLILPAAQLTSCRVDFIRQYDRSTTACAVDWDEARLLANFRALVEFRDDSLEGEITARAEREARMVLGNFVNLLTGAQVEIVFEASDTAVLPPSCQPEIPQGWSFDETTRQWTKE
jgi:hypothetical protein